ncbi:MAG: permease [Anaerococcus sp.]|nr:permease [Anaerococcus sp.]
MFTKILYVIALISLILSFFKDKDRTKLALKKSLKSFENILPPIGVVILLIGFALTFLDAQTISRILGKDSGPKGMLIAGLIGSITLIPGFVAFPLAASLLRAGAGYGQIAIFISTLMMVGIATLPMEIKYFGKKMAVKRNVLFLLCAIVTSVLIGWLM